ncbi:MAG: glycoside hydrolase/phage tail family protein [Pseudomonadota bacterium]
MATLLLSAAGSAVGGSIGGSFLGVSAAALGQAAGATIGGVIDQKILGTGSQPVEVGRARSLRLQASTEGAPIAQLYGRMRLSGQVIWATRYLENVRTTTQGGKATGGQRVREFSYSISFAVGLCEGPIDRIGRIWADGQLLDTQDLTMRIYSGTEDQDPDPKIMAVEGADQVPAYRGLAYVVFEDLPVDAFGNRIPQLNFEVYRSAPLHDADDNPERGERLSKLIRGVAMSPGSGEFSLDPEPVQYVFPQGGNQFANVNNASGRADLLQSLDELQAELPACESVSLIISWFGNDLRCGNCLVEPRIEEAGRASRPEPWRVSGLTTSTAKTVALDDAGRPLFGGTPSDGSVIRAIQALQARGQKVLLYPFLLMDIQEDNTLTDPYTGTVGQPVIPWRGRITGAMAPGQPGTSDQTAAAASEVASFFGTASASDFSVGPDGVTYTGPEEFGWRRFILHIAALGAAAGGVDSICIGSEMRGLTTLRSDRTTYPAVEQMVALAAEVRALLPDAKIGYAADWSEYFGHQPADGSGDVLFHLDPLWSDANIDFVGIDDYTPLSDWRHTGDHLDLQSGVPSIYSLPYLSENVEGGEYFDFFYASSADRVAQARQPITDGAHGEPWIYRAKDVRNWWSNPHHNRIGGVRQPAPTGWQPESKPVWLTETGCPAIDLGANTPNLFYDPKSSESALPFGSVGARDDEMQRRFLQAKLAYWQDPARNPVSTVYGGEMIPDERVFVWTWDARPFPDFPVRESVWSDGPQHRLGHWLTGRVSSGALSEVVADICRRRGFDRFDVSQLFGTVDGYAIEDTASTREALQPLMLAHGFDAFEGEDGIVFRMRALSPSADLDADRLVASDDPVEGPARRERGSAGATADLVRLSYVQSEGDYRLATAEAQRADASLARVAESTLPLALPGAQAQALTNRWLAESLSGEERISFALPPSNLDLEPGDIVTLGDGARYRIDSITDGVSREIEAVRVDEAIYLPIEAAEDIREPQLSRPPGPIEAEFLDLPVPGLGARFAVRADPWPGEAAIWSAPGMEGFVLVGRARRPAQIGALLSPLAPGDARLIQRVSIDIGLAGGALSSADELAFLNGANLMALARPDGEWELAQFRTVELTAPGIYRVGAFLRGLRGTEGLAPVTLPEGTRFVMIDSAPAEISLTPAERGLPRRYRVGPAQYGFSHPSFTESVETYQGVALRPFAPSHLRVSGRLGADIAISWIRQTRIEGDVWEGIDVALGEEIESYRLQVLQQGNVLREIILADPSFTYTAEMQAADGTQPGAEIAVAQLSRTFGFGLDRRIPLDA